MIKKWQTKIDQITEKYLLEFSGLSGENFNFKPDEKSWSIGQCIDHIITTNQQYFRIIEQVNADSYHSHWMANVPFFPSFMGNMILKSVQPETINRKNKTFNIFEPSSSDISRGVIPKFEAIQLQLKAYLAEINPKNYRVIISSPVASYIVYPLKTAIEIIIAHEERHYLQAMNVKSLILKN